MNKETDEKYMRRCLQLARCGFFGAPPNPMVGAVVVHDGQIIGEGYHIRCGGPHAEVNAINSVKDERQHGLCESRTMLALRQNSTMRRFACEQKS